jgi:hypothetical protein
MSDTLRIQIIAEGETDKIVIDAFLEAILGHPHFVSTLIQPETSRAFGASGPHGGGWKGVRGKCLEVQKRGGLTQGGYLANTDLLIVHVDGEVGDEAEVKCSQPCPPPSGTADAIERVVLSWLGDPSNPLVIIAVPMKETEAWIFAALRPEDKLLREDAKDCFECRDKPSTLLSGGPVRLIRSDKKHKSAYRAIERQLVVGYANARKLSQVRRFEERVQAACSAWFLGAKM